MTEFVARLWEEEELDRGETIDRARLLVLFSEEMELGELAGENAAELAMEEAQHVIEKRRRVGSVAGSPDAVPQTVAQLESLVRVAGGSDVLFGAAGEDETDELDASALSAALSRSLGPLNVPFSAAELDEIVVFVANGQPAFRRSDWEEFSAGQVRESAGGNLTPRGPWDGVGSAASSPATQRTPTASPQSGARAGGVALEKEGAAMAAGPAPPAAMLLLHPVEKAMSWAVRAQPLSQHFTPVVGRSLASRRVRRWCLAGSTSRASRARASSGAGACWSTTPPATCPSSTTPPSRAASRRPTPPTTMAVPTA